MRDLIKDQKIGSRPQHPPIPPAPEATKGCSMACEGRQVRAGGTEIYTFPPSAFAPSTPPMQSPTTTTSAPSLHPHPPLPPPHAARARSARAARRPLRPLEGCGQKNIGPSGHLSGRWPCRVKRCGPCRVACWLAWGHGRPNATARPARPTRPGVHFCHYTHIQITPSHG